MKQTLRVIVNHRFSERDFVGGEAALDFINTVSGRDQAAPRDRLDSYDRLLEWAAHANLLPGRLLRALAQKAQAEPAAAARALDRAKRLRESLFTLVSAVAAGKAPTKENLALLRVAWVAGAEAHALHFHDGRVEIVLDPERADLDLIGVIAAWRLVERVLTAPADRLRLCAGTDCAWLFLDTSKAGRRRWCDMAVCGNAAKSRRHYARERSART
jgi:predicted RNA-binding Zn ribbon-like protein